MRASLMESGRGAGGDSDFTKDEQTDTDTDIKEEEGGDDEDVLGFSHALVWLGVVTVFIAFLSEFISGSIEQGADSIGVSAVFLSAIVLPIVGNAAEHAGAVMFAIKGKLDLSLGVAIGSSTQIALLVLPLLVILGWISDLDMSLNFGAYESLSLLLSVITVTFAIKDGKSNWLLGFGLVATYVVISIGFFTDTDDTLSG
jgi:Ca2+:H+ antiporter